jgi:hypothetical protein
MSYEEPDKTELEWSNQQTAQEAPVSKIICTEAAYSFFMH